MLVIRLQRKVVAVSGRQAIYTFTARHTGFIYMYGAILPMFNRCYNSSVVDGICVDPGDLSTAIHVSGLQR